jgi:uncharacterized membrane protein
MLPHLGKVYRIRSGYNSSKESIKERFGRFKQLDPEEKIIWGFMTSTMIGGIIGIYQGMTTSIENIRKNNKKGYRTSFIDAPIVLCSTILGCAIGMFGGLTIPVTGPIYLYLKYTEEK